MGWAKYYEDNMSIYVGRMAMREVTPVCCCNRLENVKPSGRKGLKVVFQNGADDSMIRKMQMNGWWWSKANACWYNRDTNGNRKYAKALYDSGAKVSVVV